MDFKDLEAGFCPAGGCAGCGGCSVQLRDYIEKADAFKTDPAIRKTEYKAVSAPEEVRALLYETWEAAYWTGGKLHKPTVVTYSFGKEASNFSGNVSGMLWETTGEWREFTPTMKAAIQLAAETHSKASGLQLVYVEDPSKADIVWRLETGKNDKFGSVMAPGPTKWNGDIWINAKFYDKVDRMDLTPGSEGFQFLLHEFGHAVGMNHAESGKYKLPAWQINREYTVLTHTMDPLGNFRPDALRPLDIQALSYIYGTDAEKKALSVQWSQMFGGGLISTGGAGDDKIVGIADRDLIRPGRGNNDISSGDGNDYIDVSEGTNVVRAGRGSDTLILGTKYANRPDLIFRPNTMQVDDTGGFEGQIGSTIFTGVEKLRFVDGTFDFLSNSFVFSATYNAIVSTFKIMLDRPPTDYEAKTYGEWIDLEGKSVEYVVADIISGSDWIEAVRNLSGQQIAINLYGKIFGQEISQENIADLTHNLSNGLKSIVELVARAVSEKQGIHNESSLDNARVNIKAHFGNDGDPAGTTVFSHVLDKNEDAKVFSDISVSLDSVYTGRQEDTIVLPYKWDADDVRVEFRKIASIGHGASGNLYIHHKDISFSGVEKITFSNGSLYFSLDGVAAQIARIHMIGAGKMPTDAVFSEELRSVENGSLTTLQIAREVVKSDGFTEIFGRLPSSTVGEFAEKRAKFIDQVWDRALGLDPSASDIASWHTILQQHGHGFTGYLIDLLASSENSKVKWAGDTSGFFVADDVGEIASRLCFVATGMLPSHELLGEVMRALVAEELSEVDAVSRVFGGQLDTYGNQELALRLLSLNGRITSTLR